MTRVAVIRDFANPAGIGQFAVIQAVAPALGVEVIPVDPSDAAEIEREVGTFARSVNGGLIVTGEGRCGFNRRADRRACDPAPSARSLPRAFLRRCRRPHFLRI